MEYSIKQVFIAAVILVRNWNSRILGVFYLGKLYRYCTYVFDLVDLSPNWFSDQLPRKAEITWRRTSLTGISVKKMNTILFHKYR